MNSNSSRQNENIFFDEVIQERVKGNPLFIERTWFMHRIEKAINDSSCRFILIIGKPGVGKTTLIATLAHQYPDSLRYFLRVDNQTPYRSGNTRSFLLSIGLQLAARHRDLFRLENLEIVVRQRIRDLKREGSAIGIKVRDFIISPFYQATLLIDQQVETVGGTLIGLDVERFITNVHLLAVSNLQFLALIDPAQVLFHADPTARIVILVDALDELHTNGRRENIVHWLSHCPELPPNVRIILTSRDDPFLETFKLRQNRWLTIEEIDSTSKQVQRDMYLYTQKFIHQEKIRRLFVEHDIDVDLFTEMLVTKAQGNFLYQRTLFQAILDTADPQRQKLLLELEEVPLGLTDLYRFFLLWIKQDVQRKRADFLDEVTLKSSRRPFWTDLIKPILGVLAVAREPLSVEHILQFGRIKVEDRWFSEALEHIKQFLSEINGCYFLYHNTFAEYITSPKTRGKHYDCYIGPKEWHHNIVLYYGGNRWPWQDVDWTTLDDYGLRHLPTHMIGVSLYQELYRLVTFGEEHNKWAERHVEKEGSYGGYLHDLDLVWNWTVDQSGWNLGRQIRCVLIRSSIHSLAANIIPDLLPSLIQRKRLSVSIAFITIQHIPHVRQRAKALRMVVPFLPEELHFSALQLAETIWNDATVDEQERMNTLCAIIAYLSPELQERSIRRLWSKIRAIQDEQYFAAKISDLWNFFPDDIQTEVLEKVQNMTMQSCIAAAFAGIVLCCSSEQREQMLACVQTIEDERIRLITQARFVLYLNETEKERIVNYACTMTDEHICLAILKIVLPGLTTAQKNRAVQKAWAIIQSIMNENQSITTIANFAPYLSDAQCNVAFTCIQERQSEVLLTARTLFKLIDGLPIEQRNNKREEVQQQIQSVIDTLKITDTQIRKHLSALIKLFPSLTDEQKREVIDIAQHIPDNHQRIWVLMEIIEPRFLQCLPDSLQDNLLTIIEHLTQVIDDTSERAIAMAVLSKYATTSVGVQAFQEARNIIEGQPSENKQKAQAWLELTSYLPSEQLLVTINEALALLLPVATSKEIADQLFHSLPYEVIYQCIPDFPVDISLHLKEVMAENSTYSRQREAKEEKNRGQLSNEQKTLYLCNTLAMIRDRGNEKHAHGIIETISFWNATGFFNEEHQKLWIDTLHACAHRDRKDCMNDLIALLPLLLHISIDRALDEAEIFHALRDVERWWH